MMRASFARLIMATLGFVVLVSCATIGDMANTVITSIEDSFTTQASPGNQSAATTQATLSSTPPGRPVESRLAGNRDFSEYRSRGVELRVSRTPDSLGNFTDSPETALSRLVEYLVYEEPDPVLRLKDIHDWIATHIDYDAQSFFSGSVPEQSWYLTLQRGRAVCQGYAELFSKMLTMAGFRNEIVTGYSRGYGYNPLRPEVIQSNHAWNAVQLGDGWHLLDVTWDSGYVDGSSFHRRYSTSYFLLPPDKMIYSHFPDDAGWQLLPHPMKADVFLSTPRLDGDFFSFGITNYAQLKRSYTVAGEGEIRFDYAGGDSSKTGYQSPSAAQDSQPAGHLYLIADIHDQAGQEAKGATFVEPAAGSMSILLRPGTTGTLILDVYASRRLDSDIYEQIWSTRLLVTSPATRGFPYVYPSYYSHGAKLESPFASPLDAGSVQDVRISVPGASKVAVVAGNTWVMLSRDTADHDLFHGQITVPSVNDFGIFAQFGQSDQYAGLMKFAVK